MNGQNELFFIADGVYVTNLILYDRYLQFVLALMCLYKQFQLYNQIRKSSLFSER